MQAALMTHEHRYLDECIIFVLSLPQCSRSSCIILSTLLASEALLSLQLTLACAHGTAGYQVLRACMEAHDTAVCYCQLSCYNLESLLWCLNLWLIYGTPIAEWMHGEA